MDEKSGRIFQDENFVVEGFSGKKAEHLIGVHDTVDEEGVILFFMKAEAKPWQKFFLDLQVGFWESWPDLDIKTEMEDESYTYMDYAELYGLKGLVFESIYCANGTIYLSFKTGEKMVMSPYDPDDFECARMIVTRR